MKNYKGNKTIKAQKS